MLYKNTTKWHANRIYEVSSLNHGKRTRQIVCGVVESARKLLCPSFSRDSQREGALKPLAVVVGRAAQSQISQGSRPEMFFAVISLCSYARLRVNPLCWLLSPHVGTAACTISTSLCRVTINNAGNEIYPPQSGNLSSVANYTYITLGGPFLLVHRRIEAKATTTRNKRMVGRSGVRISRIPSRSSIGGSVTGHTCCVLSWIMVGSGRELPT